MARVYATEFPHDDKLTTGYVVVFNPNPGAQVQISTQEFYLCGGSGSSFFYTKQGATARIRKARREGISLYYANARDASQRWGTLTPQDLETQLFYIFPATRTTVIDRANPVPHKA